MPDSGWSWHSEIGVGYRFQPDCDLVAQAERFRGRPGRRTVEVSPWRSIMRWRQRSEPSGWRRFAATRMASNSASRGGVLTVLSQCFGRPPGIDQALWTGA